MRVCSVEVKALVEIRGKMLTKIYYPERMRRKVCGMSETFVDISRKMRLKSGKNQVNQKLWALGVP